MSDFNSSTSLSPFRTTVLGSTLRTSFEDPEDSSITTTFDESIFSNMSTSAIPDVSSYTLTEELTSESLESPAESSSRIIEGSTSEESLSSSLVTTTSKTISQSTSDSDIILITSSIVSTSTVYQIYPAPTTTIVPQQTVYYQQPYEITGSETSLTTVLSMSTVIPQDSTVISSKSETLTSDFEFLAAYVKEHGSGVATRNNGNGDNKGSSNTATIAGSVVGSVIGVGVILLLLWFLMRRRKRQSKVFGEKKSFSHEISSTRRYDGGLGGWSVEDPNNEKTNDPHTSQASPFAAPISGVNESNEPQVPEDVQNDTGLSSLRSSILQNQDLNSAAAYIPPVPIRTHSLPRDNNRTIDTVFEDAESESSSHRHPHSNRQYNPKSPIPQPPSNQSQRRRYQNVGLQINRFDRSTQRYTGVKSTPPTPPPSRKNNSNSSNKSTRQEDFHRHGNNRSSVNSLESSIVSEDTTDDISSDESLIRFGEDGMAISGNGSSHQGGYFKELV